MRQFVAVLLILTLLAGGLEFASDYGEALEGTPLVAMPDGHQTDDGHDPGEHGRSCDHCHFGGVHLIGLTVLQILTSAPSSEPTTPWRTPPAAVAFLSPRDRPPIA